MENFLSLFKSAEVRTLEDVIAYNKKHADKELPQGKTSPFPRGSSSNIATDFPEQDRLVDTLENPIDSEKHAEALRQCRVVAREEGIDKAMAAHGLDIIALPMDSPSPRVAAAAGKFTMRS
jgi:amidase